MQHAFLTLSVSLLCVATAFGDDVSSRSKKSGKDTPTRLVFVTGSLIPQRVQIRPVGTTTVSPIRIIGRSEIDGTGRFTTPGAFVNEPSVQVIGR